MRFNFHHDDAVGCAKFNPLPGAGHEPVGHQCFDQQGGHEQPARQDSCLSRRW